MLNLDWSGCVCTYVYIRKFRIAQKGIKGCEEMQGVYQWLCDRDLGKIECSKRMLEATKQAIERERTR